MAGGARPGDQLVSWRIAEARTRESLSSHLCHSPPTAQDFFHDAKQGKPAFSKEVATFIEGEKRVRATTQAPQGREVAKRVPHLRQGARRLPLPPLRLLLQDDDVEAGRGVALPQTAQREADSRSQSTTESSAAATTRKSQTTKRPAAIKTAERATLSEHAVSPTQTVLAASSRSKVPLATRIA